MQNNHNQHGSTKTQQLRTGQKSTPSEPLNVMDAALIEYTIFQIALEDVARTSILHLSWVEEIQREATQIIFETYRIGWTAINLIEEHCSTGEIGETASEVSNFGEGGSERGGEYINISRTW